MLRMTSLDTKPQCLGQAVVLGRTLPGHVSPACLRNVDPKHKSPGKDGLSTCQAVQGWRLPRLTGCCWK